MSESNLYKRFKNNWNGKYIQRLETKLDDGTPDLLLINNYGVVIFFELKYIEKEFKKAKLSVRKSQIAWHDKYPKSSFFLFQIGNKYYLIDGRYSTIFSKAVDIDTFKNYAMEFVNIKDVTLFLNRGVLI